MDRVALSAIYYLLKKVSQHIGTALLMLMKLGYGMVGHP